MDLAPGLLLRFFLSLPIGERGLKHSAFTLGSRHQPTLRIVGCGVTHFCLGIVKDNLWVQITDFGGS